MEAWLQEPDDKKCRSCMLAPVTSWYYEELKEQGKPELAAEVEKATEGDTLTLCKVLDNIKGKVEEPLRERLKEFDCLAQSFDPESQPEEQQQ